LRTLYLRIKDHKDIILLVLKWITIPLVFFVIYYQLFVLEDFSEALILFKDGLSYKSWLVLILVFLLMPINLGTEAMKWKLLLKKSHQMKFVQCMQSVFAGISFSIFTPKRVGDYAGRLLLIDKKRTSAAGSLFVGNFSQMVANLILGFLATIFFLRKFTIEMNELKWLVPLSLFSTMGLIFCYFNLTNILQFFKQKPFIAKHWGKIQVITCYKKQTLLLLLSLSSLKYFVFVIQFVLLLYVFGIEINLLWAIITSACVFFIKTILPLPSSLELLARGGIAIYFFGFITDNHIGILVASIVLWVINLALPAIIGSYFISKTRL